MIDDRTQAFLAVFSATQENGLSETLSFEEILGLSFGKMLEFLRNFVENLHFHGKFGLFRQNCP